MCFLPISNGNWTSSNTNRRESHVNEIQILTDVFLVAEGTYQGLPYQYQDHEEVKVEDLAPGDIAWRPCHEREKLTRLQAAIRDLKDGIGVNKTYRFNQTLGAGGFGIVALVDQYDENDNHEGQLALKLSINSHNGPLTKEAGNTDVSSLS